MIKLTKVADIWSALMRLIPFARSWQLACIVKIRDEYYTGGCDKISPDAILELQNYDIVLLIVDGKPTKSNLLDSERQYWTRLVRESNAWLN